MTQKRKKPAPPADPQLPSAAGESGAVTGAEPSLPRRIKDLYVVSDKIVPVDPAEIDRLEQAIGSLPLGYREFMLRCGGSGTLCDSMTVWPPGLVERRTLEERSKGLNTWVNPEVDPPFLTEEDLAGGWHFGEMWMFRAIYCPRHRGSLFIASNNLPVAIVERPSAFLEPLLLIDRPIDADRFEFPFFEPDGPHRNSVKFQLDTDREMGRLADWMETYWATSVGAVRRTRIPLKIPADLVFIRRVGGMVAVAKTASGVGGFISFDAEHFAEADRFLADLQAFAGSREP